MKSLKLIAISLLGLNLVGNSCWGMENTITNQKNHNVKENTLNIPSSIGNPYVNSIPNIGKEKKKLYVGSPDLNDMKVMLKNVSKQIQASPEYQKSPFKKMGDDLAKQVINSVRMQINTNEKWKRFNEDDRLLKDVFAVGLYSMVVKSSKGTMGNASTFLNTKGAEIINNQINIDVKNTSEPHMNLLIPEDIK